MPRYRTHLLGGVISFILLSLLLTRHHQSLIMHFIFFISALGGSLFPDIDTRSIGQLWFYRIMTLILIISLTQQRIDLFLGLSVLSALPLFVRHRGIFHKTWFIVLCGALPTIYAHLNLPHYTYHALLISLFFITGALSHTLLDQG